MSSSARKTGQRKPCERCGRVRAREHNCTHGLPCGVFETPAGLCVPLCWLCRADWTLGAFTGLNRLERARLRRILLRSIRQLARG